MQGEAFISSGHFRCLRTQTFQKIGRLFRRLGAARGEGPENSNLPSFCSVNLYEGNFACKDSRSMQDRHFHQAHVEEWAPYFNDHVAVVADALTTPPTQTRGELLRLQPEVDPAIKRERALYMLRDIEKSIAELQAQLPSDDANVRFVNRALEEGDAEELKELGISDEYSWLDDCVRALIDGAPFLEVETVGPYISHHLDEDNQLSVNAEGFPADEVAGLMIGRVISSMARQCANFRTVALIDDLASPDGTERTKQQGDHFIMAIGSVLRNFGLITTEDQAGIRYHLIRESDQIKGVEEIISRLRDCENGMVDESAEGDVFFYPTEALIEQLAIDSENRKREFRRRGILIKRAGRPTCHALDAATFLSSRSSATMHLVVLDKHFMSQQEKTYAIVRALDLVTQSRYHNIFFDCERLSPTLVTYAISQLIAEHLRRYVRVADRMDDWENFNPEEYVSHHYGSAIAPEDQEIIRFVTDRLKRERIRRGSLSLVADVGSGPNFYPSMMLAPYVKEDGAIDMVEYSAVNRRYAESVISRFKDAGESGEWAKYEQFMVGAEGHVYDSAFRRVCDTVNLVQGSIFALPRNRYDIVASYFVPDSITTSRAEFWESIRAMARAVKEDGLLILAHMIGSREYSAGGNTHFPSVELTARDVAEAYRDADLEFEMIEVSDDNIKVRTGYRAMTVCVARKKQKN
jgi:hypothetical protein